MGAGERRIGQVEPMGAVETDPPGVVGAGDRAGHIRRGKSKATVRFSGDVVVALAVPGMNAPTVKIVI